LRGPSPGAVDAVEPLAAAWSLGDGKFTSGFPVGTGDRFRGGFTIADLDADGRPEAIFGDGQYRLHAVSSAGVSPKGWPKATAGAVTGTPAAGDLDGDGRLEVVAATAEGLVFAWRTEGRAADRIPWEGARHDHRATGNVETETTRRGAVQNDEGCGCRSTGRDQKALWLLACAGLCGLIARRPAR
jgi:hypothetical protein